MDQYTSDLLIKWGYSSTSVYLLNVTADVNETPLDSSFMGRLLRDLDNPSENCSPSTSIQRDSSCLAPRVITLRMRRQGKAKGQHNNGLLNSELRKELANLIIRDKLQADPNKLLSEHSTVEVAELLKIWNILTLDPGRQLNRLGLQHFLHGYIFVPRKANKEESELNVSLLLPFIINISPVRRKDSWKASRSEVRDGFITHVPTDREILVALAERRKLAKEKSTSIAYYLTRCPLIRIIMLMRLSELANFNVFHIKMLSPLPKHINHNEKLHFICDN
ncbi:hypothetical protein EVAR_85619_1 [Eumeta japonica]|uniref:Uncharacterized protein n=1 Tax=Eumeta variegata TaxID=151549 RepID=A0A4C1XVH6_EUMVA|nr:hypothetical protein EVAR_85619_1 [Eumeta japonica]